MSEYVCPECGAVLIRGRHDFAAHAFSHWGVGARHIERIPNTEGQKRDRSILEAEREPVNSGEEETKNGKVEIIGGVL